MTLWEKSNQPNFKTSERLEQTLNPERYKCQKAHEKVLNIKERQINYEMPYIPIRMVKY